MLYFFSCLSPLQKQGFLCLGQAVFWGMAPSCLLGAVGTVGISGNRDRYGADSASWQIAEGEAGLYFSPHFK